LSNKAPATVLKKRDESKYHAIIGCPQAHNVKEAMSDSWKLPIETYIIGGDSDLVLLILYFWNIVKCDNFLLPLLRAHNPM
jgi:hypothetical protein